MSFTLQGTTKGNHQGSMAMARQVPFSVSVFLQCPGGAANIAGVTMLTAAIAIASAKSACLAAEAKGDQKGLPSGKIRECD